MAKANLGIREKRLYKAVVHELTTDIHCREIADH